MIDLWPSNTSRIYSAYNRLASLTQLQDSEQPIAMAELGLINYSDESKKFGHFMEGKTPVERIYKRIDNTEGSSFESQVTRNL